MVVRGSLASAVKAGLVGLTKALAVRSQASEQ